jgi:hypothetical protein
LASKTFCHHPEYLAYAGGAILIMAVGAKSTLALVAGMTLVLIGNLVGSGLYAAQRRTV